jgi:dolichol kinase
MVHVSCSCVVVYYLFPDNILLIRAVKVALLLATFITASCIEIIRLKGKLNKAFMFPFRKYETYRVGAHIWLGSSVILLLLLFPQQIAAPCILSVCFADPVIGELRDRKRVIASIAGFAICLGIFLMFEYSLYLALLAACLAVIAESIRLRSIDDNLLMPLIPAIVILVLWVGNLISLPAPLIEPFHM